MTVDTFSFTTGPCTLPDRDISGNVGILRYNGCSFSPLFESSISGNMVQDAANRTVKYMDYTLTADGYVTLPDGASNLNSTMADLRRLLTEQGGALVYKGRGFDLTVNDVVGPRSARIDVVWGPEPKLLEFQTLGGGGCAKVKWQVRFRIVETERRARGIFQNVLQFNYDTSVTYNEDGYSTLAVRGVLEIPMTRDPSITSRTLRMTVDDRRSIITSALMSSVDLSRFRVVDRQFPVSRDKRTIEWSFKLEEKPYMDLPPGSTIARGTYSVRPAKAGPGLCLWLCTLKATYTVRADWPRRVAWFRFLELLRWRMQQSGLGHIPSAATLARITAPPRGGVSVIAAATGAAGVSSIALTPFAGGGSSAPTIGRRAWLVDFSADEGIYLDSKTTSFSATWRLVTTFSHILVASGLWKKLPETDGAGRNMWASSMTRAGGGTIMDDRSWLVNRVDPRLDYVVDFGGP